MPDPTSAPDRDHAPADDDWPDDDAPAPARARRRLATPWTLGLGAVVLVVAGFIGGVQVQKGQADPGGAAAGGGNLARAGFAGPRGGGATGAGDGQDAPTFGSVTSKKGSTLYVADADGTTVRVKTNAQSKITRTATTSAGAVHPGDTVVVQGTKNAAGDIVATQIGATAQDAAGSGRGALAGAGGARPFRQSFGAPPGG